MNDLPVVVTPHAEANVREIHQWWATNRLAAPFLFLDELSLGISLIGSFPKLGKKYGAADVPALRRYLLRSTRFHIYYIDTEVRVTVLSVWGALRGTTPSFRALLEEFQRTKA